MHPLPPPSSFLSNFFNLFKNNPSDNSTFTSKKTVANNINYTESTYRQSAEEITDALEKHRHHHEQHAINYLKILNNLDYAFSNPGISNKTLTNTLLELTKHFPYIASKDQEVRNKLWELLSKNADKVEGEDFIQKANKGHIWTNIATYLEIFFFEKDSDNIGPPNKKHSLFQKLYAKRDLILEYINTILKNKAQTSDEFNNIIQALDYLNFQQKNNNLLHEKISNLIFNNAEIISNHCNQLVEVLNSNTPEKQLKPWISALHFYRVCSRNHMISIQQSGAISNLINLILRRYDAIPPYLHNFLSKEFTKSFSQRIHIDTSINVLINKYISQCCDHLLLKGNKDSFSVASSAYLLHSGNNAFSTHSLIKPPRPLFFENR